MAHNTFPQSKNLRAQLLARELSLKTNHLVAYWIGAKTNKPLLVPLAGWFLSFCHDVRVSFTPLNGLSFWL